MCQRGDHALEGEKERRTPPSLYCTLLTLALSTCAVNSRFDCIFFDDFPIPVPGTDEVSYLHGTGSRWHHFIDLCVSHHMNKGSRITGYLSQDIDLGRPDVSYTRRPFKIAVPEDCQYSETGLQTYYIPLVTLVEEPRVCSHIMSGGRKDPPSCQVVPEAGDTAIVGQPSRSQRKRRLVEAVLAKMGND